MIGNNNNNIDDNINLKKNNLTSNIKIKLNLHSSGSFGVVLKNEFSDEIYKITLFSCNDEINTNNFVEMVYLNYFKNKYDDLYKNDGYKFIPIQNINTYICYLDDFVELYKIDKSLYNEIINVLNCDNNDIIILNKMKYYPNNLGDYIKKNKIGSENITTRIENLILGLHLIHSNNLAHGDLKSNNIVLDNKEIKIIDFGGIKSILNPKYECTCTSTYRSPEDLGYEYKKKTEKINWKNDPIKSDIWSLGIIIYEMVFEKNPIFLKYFEIKKKYYGENKKYDEDENEKFIEYKINEYFKTINCIEIIDSEKKIFEKGSTIEQLLWYKIIKNIEKILHTDPKIRPSLEEIYSDLFLRKLPNFEKFSLKFNYKIRSEIYKNRFVKFRQFYYRMIFDILRLNNEMFLYPMLTNLYDRFLIFLFNNTKNGNILYDKKIHEINIFEIDNLTDISKLFLDIENIIYYDLENIESVENIVNLEKSKYQLDHMGIITCTIYLIVKILIIKKIDNINSEFYKFKKIFSKKFIQNSFSNIFNYFLINLINILNKLNWDILRTKLYFYSDENKEKIFEIIEIINNFDVEKIINYIE